MSTAWPLPEPDDPLPRPKLTLHQQLVSDSITNTYEREGAAGPAADRQMPQLTPQPPDQQSTPVTAGREPGRIDWSLVLEQSDLDPSDFDSPEDEWLEPAWPDPAWPGFAGGRSYSFVFAVSPLLIERHPDKAARLW